MMLAGYSRLIPHQRKGCYGPVCKGLVAEGWLVQVELPGEPPRYETATKAHHHHFQGRTCGQVYEIEGCPEDVQPFVPSGFLLDG